MKRLAEAQLCTWFLKKDRMPLIIRGARQVGKSTLVRLFAEAQKLDLVEVNFEITKLRSLNQSDFVLQDVIDEIQIKTKKVFTEKTILFLDEIQEEPRLLKGLRYFYENRSDIAVIAAGSLLEVAMQDESFSFPVGRVEFFHLGPMNFTEYLWATGNHQLEEKLDKLFFSPHLHEVAKKELQKFYYIGGMPKCIQTYIETKSIVPVRAVQNQIIQTYIADFPKYNSRIRLERVVRIFKACALILGKKVIYQHLDPGAKSRDIKRVVELLIDAKVLLPCFHSDANQVPLAGESDGGILKVYFLDVGLYNALTGLELDVIDVEMKTNFATKGFIAEQFIAQHLAYAGDPALPPELYYWLRDKGSQKGEIDFLLQDHAQIVPIEVKSKRSGHLKALLYFINEKKKSIGVKISLDEFQVENMQHKLDRETVKAKLIHIPQYAITQIKKILSTI